MRNEQKLETHWIRTRSCVLPVALKFDAWENDMRARPQNVLETDEGRFNAWHRNKNSLSILKQHMLRPSSSSYNSKHKFPPFLTLNHQFWFSVHVVQKMFSD